MTVYTGCRAFDTFRRENTIMPIDDDQILKTLVETFFREFMDSFFPDGEALSPYSAWMPDRKPESAVSTFLSAKGGRLP